MKLKFFKETINETQYYRLAFNEACNLLVINGIYKSTISAETTITKKIRKEYIIIKK